MAGASRMLLIAPSFRPGASGVGDYVDELTRRLRDRGVESIIIGAADPFCDEIVRADGALPTLRIPRGRLAASAEKARRFVEEFRPDSVSLQFVGYGYHPKARTREFREWLEALSLPSARHVMFHEIWIGAACNARFKDRLIGKRQRRELIRFFRAFRPRVAHCHSRPYRACLRHAGIAAKELPLFGNVSAESASPAESRDVARFGMFSGAPPELDLRSVVETLGRILRECGRRGRLRFFGRTNVTEAMRAELDRAAGEALTVELIGELGVAEVAEEMRATDFAIAGAPQALWEKSSVIASWRACGVRVVFPRDDVRFGASEPVLPSGLVRWEDFPEALRRPPSVTPPPSPGTIARRMLDDLNAAAGGECGF